MLVRVISKIFTWIQTQVGEQVDADLSLARRRRARPPDHVIRQARVRVQKSLTSPSGKEVFRQTLDLLLGPGPDESSVFRVRQLQHV